MDACDRTLQEFTPSSRVQLQVVFYPYSDKEYERRLNPLLPCRFIIKSAKVTLNSKPKHMSLRKVTECAILSMLQVQTSQNIVNPFMQCLHKAQNIDTKLALARQPFVATTSRYNDLPAEPLP